MWQNSLLSKIGRITSPGRKLIREIDGLRFIAIMLVVLFHLIGYLNATVGVAADSVTNQNLLTRLLFHGHYGVQLFFSISGFILALPFAINRLQGGAPVNLAAYYKRRITRLEPPFILSLIALFFLYALAHRLTLSSLAPHLLSGLVYLHNLIFNAANPISPVTWSLEIEIQFYLLAPVFACVYLLHSRTLRRGLLAGAILLMIAVKVLLIHPHTRLAVTLVNELDFFLVGYLLADIYVADWNQSPAKSFWWDCVSLVGWSLLVCVWELTGLTPWLFPALVLAVYCAAFRGRISSRILTNPAIVLIGGMCYSLYLLHAPIIPAMGRLTHGLIVPGSFAATVVVQGLLIVPPVIIIGALFYLMIERPCMNPRWPSELLARFRFGQPGTVRPSTYQARASVD